MDAAIIMCVPLSIFLIITLTFLAKYSFDRRQYKNATRRAANNIENSNTTVLYTIPTTGQLNTAYPELQRQYSNGRPPPYVSSGESPPSYDQAVSIPVNQAQGESPPSYDQAVSIPVNQAQGNMVIK